MPVPSVIDELKRHNQIVLNMLTDKICVKPGAPFLAAFVILTIGIGVHVLADAIRGALPNSPPLIDFFGVKGQALSTAIVILAVTFLYLHWRASKTRSSTFALALGEIAQAQNLRHHFLIRRILRGGKIAEVLHDMQVENGNEVSVMWSFFYREEQTSELIARCKRDRLKLRILLIAPDAEGLRQRMQDLEGDYHDPVDSVFKQVSLSNQNFSETIQKRIREDASLRGLIEVRFADHYVGRPVVIVRGKTPNIGQAWLWLWLYVVKNFDRSLFAPVRVAVGMYMFRESSAYPFIEFHSERVKSDVNLLSQDVVDLFEARWRAARIAVK